MGYVRSLTTFPVWDRNFKGYKGRLQEELFVIYNNDGDLCKNSIEQDPELYRSYLDPSTGYIFAYKCYFCIFLSGVAALGASIVRPFMIAGVEIADAFQTRQLNIIKRIQNICRAALYSVALFFCALAVVLMPFSTYFWTKLSAIEFAANRGIHKVKSLRKEADKNKFVLYLTGQPLGHFTQRRDECAKYKLLDLENYDNSAIERDSKGFITKGFAVELKKKDKSYEVNLWKRQLRGDDKVQIEKAINKLIEFMNAHYKYDVEQLTHVTELGVHFVPEDIRMNLGEVQEELSLMAYTRKLPSSKKEEHIPLTQLQKDEIKKLGCPFLKITPKMTCEDLWVQIKEQITKLP